MADYEAGAWSSWHHHMALVALAHLVRDLDQARRQARGSGVDVGHGDAILRAAFAKPTLSEQESIDLIDYHLDRNKADTIPT